MFFGCFFAAAGVFCLLCALALALNRRRFALHGVEGVATVESVSHMQSRRQTVHELIVTYRDGEKEQLGFLPASEEEAASMQGKIVPVRYLPGKAGAVRRADGKTGANKIPALLALGGALAVIGGALIFLGIH